MESSTGEVANAVVSAVAAATGRDALSLPPLAAAVDPDVLESLVRHSESGTLTFTYAGREVAVTHDGEVDVRDESAVGRAPRPRVRGGAVE